MAALATQNIGKAGGAITLAAASAGGDTIQAGTMAGGWASPVFLIVTVGATATTVTVNGVAKGALTNQTAIYPVFNIYRGRRLNITYSQVTSVTVGAVSTGPAVTGV